MKIITSYVLPNDTPIEDTDAVSTYMDNMERQDLTNTSWPNYLSTVEANFSIGHKSEWLFIKFRVKEANLKVKTSTINGPVNKDNCVEFFVKFPNQQEYYNLEFNCLGVGKVAYGKERLGREFLSESYIKDIKIDFQLKYQNTETINPLKWEILMMIPAKLFCFSNIKSFIGININANFYKCGDDLPDAHFLTWNAIETAEPDFHQPNFFGEVKLT